MFAADGGITGQCVVLEVGMAAEFSGVAVQDVFALVAALPSARSLRRVHVLKGLIILDAAACTSLPARARAAFTVAAAACAHRASFPLVSALF